ncbi:YjcQ family protein [Gottschalkia purinilytica]|nr:YjcQ family protein [Gottschalkia purinilytica]
MKIIYKILERLDKAMDEERFDWNEIDHNTFGITKIRWVRIMHIMNENGFIDGVSIVNTIGQKNSEVRFIDIRITLKGLEYLAENSNMGKLITTAKLLKDIIPDI